MKPLLEDQVDARWRALLFLPAGLLAGLLLFALLGIALQIGFAWGLMAGLTLGFTAAWLLVGTPTDVLPQDAPWAQALRRHAAWLFFPLALVLAVVLYAVLGIVWSELGLPPDLSAVAPLALALVLGAGLAHQLVGFPHLFAYVRAARSRVPDPVQEHREWFFLPVALVLAAVLYVLLGIAYTAVPVLPTDYGAMVSLVLALVLGSALAYVLVGFPSPAPAARRAWAQIPEDRRPWLFLPLGLVLTVALFLLLGLAWTALPVLPLDLGVYATFPLALVLGFGAAYALVGAPTPQRRPREMLPEIPDRGRPVAFLVTFLLLGPPLTFLAGVGVNLLPPLSPVYPLLLSALVGYLLAFAVATLAWGLPGRWKGARVPRLPEGVRLALLLPLWIAATAGLALLLEMLTPLDLVGSLVVGASLGLLLALKLTGATDRIRPEDRATLLPELPDAVKPLVLFPAWIVLGTLAFFLLGVAGLPFHWSVLAGASLGLALALGLVEEPLLRAWWRERRERRRTLQQVEERVEGPDEDVDEGEDPAPSPDPPR